MLKFINKIGKKLVDKVGEGLKSVPSKIMTSIRDFFYSAIDKVRYFFTSPLIVVFICVLIALIIVGYVLALYFTNDYVKGMKDYCVAERISTSSDVKSTVKSNPDSYIMDNGYRYEQTTQKSSYESSFDAKLDKNSTTNKSQTVKLSITGLWSPWFGDEKIVDDNLNDEDDEDYINVDTPDDKFLCNMQKVALKDRNFGGTEAENEYYFLRNYYKNVSVSGKTIGYEELDSNLQQQCKLNRGMGLYMGFFGKDGKTEPEHFHHVLATKATCEENYMFEGNAEGLSIKYGNNTYKFDDFKKDYFRITKSASNGGNVDKNIFYKSDGEYIYDIEVHEEKLRGKLGTDSKDVGLIVANAISAFNQACYETRNGEREQKAKFIFEASFKSDSSDGKQTVENYKDKHRLLKSYNNDNGTVGTEYDDGEVIKFFILDRYYKDNQGEYKIEFLNGVKTISDAGTIEEFLKKIEIFLLGSRVVNSDKDRIDGLVYKMYTGIIANSGLASLARAILALFVVFNGFMVLLGYKKFDKKEFMIFCIKISALFAFFSETAWAFFNKTVINFIVNGTIGAINLIYDILGNVFNGFGVSNVFIENSYFDANKSLYLSSNFKFLDTVFDFLFSKEVHVKVLSWILEYPVIGFIPAVIFYSLLFKYVLALLGSVIPYITTLIQITILLGLTPIFLLFMFFETLNKYFKSWLNYLLSRMFELIVFFFVIFFASELINNRFLDVLAFEICKFNLTESIQESISSGTAGGKILKSIVEGIFGDFFVLARQNYISNYFETIFNLILLACYIYLYQQFTQFLTQILTKLYSFDGEGFAGSTGGGYFDSSLDQQLNKATGMENALNTAQNFMSKTSGLSTVARYTGLDKIKLFKDGKFSVATTLKSGISAGKSAFKAVVETDHVEFLGLRKDFTSIKQRIDDSQKKYMNEKNENRKLNRELLSDDEKLKELLGDDVFNKASEGSVFSEFSGVKNPYGINLYRDAIKLGKLNSDSQEYKDLKKQQDAIFRNSIINRRNDIGNKKNEVDNLIKLAQRRKDLFTDEEIEQLRNGKLNCNTNDGKAKEALKNIDVNKNKSDNIHYINELAELVRQGYLDRSLVGMDGIDLDTITDDDMNDDDYEKIIDFLKVGNKTGHGSGYGRKLDRDYTKRKEALENARLSDEEMDCISEIEESIRTNTPTRDQRLRKDKMELKLEEEKFKELYNDSHGDNKDGESDEDILNKLKDAEYVFEEVQEVKIGEETIQVFAGTGTELFGIKEDGGITNITYNTDNCDFSPAECNSKLFAGTSGENTPSNNMDTNEYKSTQTEIKSIDVRMKLAKINSNLLQCKKNKLEGELKDGGSSAKKLEKEIKQLDEEIENQNSKLGSLSGRRNNLLKKVTQLKE